MIRILVLPSGKKQLELSVTNEEVISAEIRWVLKCVASGFSSSLRRCCLARDCNVSG